MIIQHWLSNSSGFFAMAGNHIWQSTCFAAAVGILNLSLRKKRARLRYSLWFIASIKFLLPFSLLIALGSMLPVPHQHAPQTPIYTAIQNVGHPFMPTPTSAGATSNIQPLATTPPSDWLLGMIALAWLSGSMVILFIWIGRWAKVASLSRTARRSEAGREAQLLRRLEQVTGRRSHLQIMLSRESLEPGIFGVFRPVLVWPERLSEKLGDQHIEAILAHELEHRRWHDNRTAVVHMIVETLFWFHPFVWWIERRMIEERERACDEAVIQIGAAPEDYAEGLLKACRFCIESPLACLAGITGASLNKRIVSLMTKKPGNKLNRGNKLLLALAGTATVVIPIMLGLTGTAQSTEPDPAAMSYRFAVASVRPSGSNGMVNMVRLSFDADSYSATNATVQMLIKDAYGIGDKQLVTSALPKDTTRYDIEAKIDNNTMAALSKMNSDELKAAHQQMLRSLLAERFKLSAHWDEKELAVYSLEIAKGGPKLHEAKPGDTYASGIKDRSGNLVGPHMMMSRLGGGQISGQGVSLNVLIAQLSGQLHELIIDKTGLKGTYDFNLQWTPDHGPSPIPDATDHNVPGADSANDSGPSLFTAIQEQLGLKLQPTRGPVKVLVVDHLEHPSEN